MVGGSLLPCFVQPFTDLVLDLSLISSVARLSRPLPSSFPADFGAAVRVFLGCSRLSGSQLRLKRSQFRQGVQGCAEKTWNDPLTVSTRPNVQRVIESELNPPSGKELIELRSPKRRMRSDLQRMATEKSLAITTFRQTASSSPITALSFGLTSQRDASDDHCCPHFPRASRSNFRLAEKNPWAGHGLLEATFASSSYPLSPNRRWRAILHDILLPTNKADSPTTA